eukprot:evm.model.scf_1373.5 EVM.evm.TU.scf_1373.5   scf_1373:36153-41262(+)
MAADPAAASLLLGLHDVYSGWSYWLCYFMHCVHAASMAPDLKRNFLLHYWATYLACFGGGFVSALLIMRPELAPIPLFSSNYELLLWTSAWWLVNYCPFNLTGRILTFWPVMMIMEVGSNFARSDIIAKRVDLAVKLYPGVVAPPIILGTIGGMAGKASLDLIKRGLGSGNGTLEIMVPGFVWRSALLSAMTYYYLVHWAGQISSEEGLALVRTVLIVHGLLSDLSGWPLDVTKPIALVACTASNIPDPSEEKPTSSSASIKDNGQAPSAKANAPKDTKKTK